MGVPAGAVLLSGATSCLAPSSVALSVVEVVVDDGKADVGSSGSPLADSVSESGHAYVPEYCGGYGLVVRAEAAV